MSIYGRQLQPPTPHDEVVDKNGRMTLQGLQHPQRLWEWVAAGFVTIPCDVSGTADAIILTPMKRPDRGASGYASLLIFSFVAAAASTGAATITVQRDADHSLSAIPAYKGASAAPVGAGDIVAGVPYLAIYCDEMTSPVLPARMVLK